jgi:hypothetical protein
MNNYPIDLELRRRVAEAYHCNGESKAVIDVIVENTFYERSFDAIMPLVRHGGIFCMDALVDIWTFSKAPDFVIWLIEEATPADYCRAYLAAKGEKE